MTRGGKQRQRQRDLPSGNQPRSARRLWLPVVFVVWWVLAAPAAAAATQTTPPGHEQPGGEPAASSVVWHDPVGDGNVGPPDITTVTASNTDDGVVTVRVEIPGTPVLPDDLDVHVFLDVDESSQTGNSTRRHAEYAVQVNGETSRATLYRWDEPAWLWREVASDGGVLVGERTDNHPGCTRDRVPAGVQPGGARRTGRLRGLGPRPLAALGLPDRRVRAAPAGLVAARGVAAHPGRHLPLRAAVRGVRR